MAKHRHHHHAQNAHHHPAGRHIELAIGLGCHGVNAANHAQARGQHHHNQHQHDREKAAQHLVHELDAIRWLQALRRRAQKKVGKEHATHPDDDGKQVNQFEQNKKHGRDEVSQKMAQA